MSVRRTGGDDAAIDQHRDAVGEREHGLHVVLDQHDRHFLAQLQEQLHHARGFGDAETGHRLVEQQQLRPGRERDRKLEFALLAMAELGDRHIGAGRKTDAFERGRGSVAQTLLFPRIAPEAEGVPVMRLRCERDIVGGGEIRQQRGDLEGTREPERTTAIGRHVRDVAAAEKDAAGVRREMTGELADQRGLAGAVRADDRVQLAFRDVERNVIGREDAAEAAH